MTKIFNRLLLLACLMAPTAATAQVCLVSKGKPQGRIVLAEDNDVNRKAAKMLQRFVPNLTSQPQPNAPRTTW